MVFIVYSWSDKRAWACFWEESSVLVDQVPVKQKRDGSRSRPLPLLQAAGA